MPRSRKTTNFLPVETAEIGPAPNPIDDILKSGAVVNDVWTWTNANIWRDVDSWRIVMNVQGNMKIKAIASGQFRITFDTQQVVRAHRFVWKLDAYNATNVLLFTLVSPPFSNLADLYTTSEQLQVQGRSLKVKQHISSVDYWIRRGAGEYRD